MKKGRKSKYETHILPYLELVEAWFRDGATEREIAKKLGVAYSTFQSYKVFPEFSDSLKKSRELADVRVENALFKSAVGFEYEEVRTERTENGKMGQRGDVRNTDAGTCSKTVTTRKFIPGDVTAQIFWLKNRLPEKWRDRKELDASIADSMEMRKFRETLDSMTTEEKMRMLKNMELGNK